MAAKGVILTDLSDEVSASEAASPTALVPVANRSMLSHALDSFGAAGVRSVAVVGTRRSREQLEAAAGECQADVTPTFLEAPTRTGLASSLAVAEEFLADDAFVLQRGDGLLLDDLGPLLEELDDQGADALLLMHRVTSDTVHSLSAAARELLPLIGKGVTAGPGLAMAGVHLFGGDFMRTLRPVLCREEALAPGMLGNTARRAGARAQMRVIRNWRGCAGRPEDILSLNRFVLDAIPASRCAQAVPEGCTIEGRVVIDPTATIRSSTVRGPAIIGAGARIVDAYVGPYTAIGDGACVDNAEIEHSVLLAGACVEHAGVRLESCLLGRDARVRRDFGMPRTLRVRLWRGGEVILR